LELLDTGNPPYRIVKIYDDPPPLNDNQERNFLRDIEIDGSGKLYITNAHHLNESDLLWKFDSQTGVMEQCLGLIDPGHPNINISAPTALCISEYDSLLYLTSSQNAPDANSVLIYGLSPLDLSLVRIIEIRGMNYVTAIAVDPIRGSLWATGFSLDNIPTTINPSILPSFYHPYMAQVPFATDVTGAVPLDANDLALPLSIVWTNPLKCSGADLDYNGFVGAMDMLRLAENWIARNCDAPNWCDRADIDQNHYVDFADFKALSENWLLSGCN
jgi:hypothetical protein